MRVARLREFGPPEVLHVEEAPQPVPNANEVLVRVHAASVSFADRLVRNFRGAGAQQFYMPFLFYMLGRASFGVLRPRVRVLGSEFSGVVERVGERVQRFAPGDAVFGFCGPRMGADAEYLCLPENALITRKPANISHVEAATLPYAAMIALDLMQRLHVRPGDRILVNGASGGLGPLILQIAKHRYHAVVTGVCSTAKLDMVRALGADAVIDYTREDFASKGQTYDLVIDILGKSSFARVRPVLSRAGRLVYVSFKERQLLQAAVSRFASGPRVLCMLLNEKQENLELARALVEAGELRAIVDRVYPLAQIADAHRYAEGHTCKGAVVLSLAAGSSPSHGDS